jgi:phosphatidylglycerophosphate synthase
MKPSPRRPQRRRSGAAAALLGGFLVEAALLTPLLVLGRVDPAAAAAAIVTYALIAALVWQARDWTGRAGFGLANTVTCLRAGMIAVLPSLILAREPPDPGLAWAVIGFALAALALDGLDGRLARRRDESSAFGARFDMEVDAGFVLFLSSLVATTGRVGPWVVSTGLMRYLWIGAGLHWPLLRQPLPSSLFRKSVCVVLLLLLLAALAPIVPPDWAPLPCLAGLGLLLASFGRDLVWLVRRAGMATPARIQKGASLYDGTPRVESE